VALTDTCEEDTEIIPPAETEPAADPQNFDQAEEITEVIFDLETTGRGFKPQIIQIAAKHGEASFCQYVAPPDGFIPAHITDLTGIYIRDQNMFAKGERVESANTESALQDFIKFLPQKCVLVGHNTHMFDTRILLLQMKEHNLVDNVKEKVAGFMDTLPMARELYPNRKGAGGYKQEAPERIVRCTQCLG
jgi:DNA polymerase III alpha subunit (gram-positive type)